MNLPKLPDGCNAVSLEAIRVTGPIDRLPSWLAIRELLERDGWDVGEVTYVDNKPGRWALRAWRDSR